MGAGERAEEACPGGECEGGGSVETGAPARIVDTHGALGEFGADATSAERASACFDGHDNDADGSADCKDPACQGAFSACCVGVVSNDCCDAPRPRALLDPAACTMGTLDASCSRSGLVLVGGRWDVMKDGDRPVGLHPNGNGQDVELRLDSPIDTATDRIAIRATLVVPLGGGDATRTRTVSFGLGRNEPGSTTYVSTPAISVLLSDAVTDARLIVGETVVASAPRRAPEETHVLRIDPGGRIVWSRVEDGELVTLRTVNVDVRGATLVSAWGRESEGATDAALLVEALSVDTSTCDMPAGVGASVVLTAAGATAPIAGTSPSATVYSQGGKDHVALAWESGGDIFVANADNRPDAIHPPPVAEPTLGPAQVTIDGAAASRLAEPTLVSLGPNSWRLYAVASRAGGESVVVTTHAHGALPTVDLPLDIVAVTFDAALDGYDISGPEVRCVSLSPLTCHMVARVERRDDARDVRIVRLVSIGGLEFDLPHPHDLDGATLVRPARDRLSFDTDDVSEPTLVAAARGWELYYTGSRGTRQAIGMMASDDLEHWNALGHEVMTPSNLTGTPNKLGVGAPSVVELEGSQVLYFEGLDDAARSVLMRASRNAAEARK